MILIMHVETLGHASLYLTDSENKPILITDPWLIGSTYWRSWWLQNYPNENRLNEIYKTMSIFITHEHPDHFHLPTLKRFSNKSNIIIPDLPNNELCNFLKNEKYNHEVINKNQWKLLDKKNNIFIFSIPLWNDDSILLIDTAITIIINLNDSKPSKFIIKKLQKFIKKSKKKSILLSSYSPASIVNSFRLNKEVLSIKSKKDYVSYINKLCDQLEADIFMPFASQAIFQRKDSFWANEFKVTFDDLSDGWKTNKTKLAPCYAKISLNDSKITYLKKEDYNTRDEYLIYQKTLEQKRKEIDYKFSGNDLVLLEKKIKKINFFISIFFKNGIGFKIDDKNFLYQGNKIYDISDSKEVLNRKKDFIIEVPGLVLKDVLETNHFGDLGITMFTLIHSRKGLDPRLVYIFFILIGLDDYGHIKSFRKSLKWLTKQIYNYLSFLLKPIKIL